MWKSTLVILTVLAAAGYVVSKEAQVRPFSKLLEATEKPEPRWRLARRGWGFRRYELAALFRAERKRLDRNFDREVIKLLGKSVERHLAVAGYLEAKEYLGDDLPRPYLALAIYQQALLLCDEIKNEDAKADQVTISMSASILAKRLGFHTLAKTHKARAEQLIKLDDNLRGAIPAMAGSDWKIYESIKTERTQPETQPRPEAVPDQGVLGFGLMAD